MRKRLSLLLVVVMVAVAAVALVRSAGTAHAAAPGLHVSGTRIVDQTGATVHLHGVNYSGTEYACIQGFGVFDGAGQPTQAMVNNLLAAHVNSVRIPLNEDCWLAINGAPAAYAGANYQSAIHAWVTLLESNGITPILELHWSAAGTAKATGQQSMPDTDHSIPFWRQVATTYSGEPAAIFDLYNEPYPQTWACWKNGGASCNEGFSVAGMQTLIDTVRGASANNVIMLGCLGYANECGTGATSWVGQAPSDSAHNIAASVHVYLGNTCVTTACWDSQWKPILTAGYPLVDGEFGAYDYNGGSYSESFGSMVLNWLDTNQASGENAWTWNAWNTWSPSAAEPLIADDAGATLTTWGKYMQSQYATRYGGAAPTATPAATSVPPTPTTPATPTATPVPPTPTAPGATPTPIPATTGCAAGAVFCDGLESGTATWTEVQGDSAVVTSPTHTGQKALRATVTSTAGATSGVVKKLTSPQAQVDVSAYVYVNKTTTWGAASLLSLYDSHGYFLAWVSYDPSLKTLWLDVGDKYQWACSQQLPTGNWHNLDLSYSSTRATLSLDGTAICTETGGFPTDAVQTIKTGIEEADASLSLTTYVDDVTVR